MRMMKSLVSVLAAVSKKLCPRELKNSREQQRKVLRSLVKFCLSLSIRVPDIARVQLTLIDLAAVGFSVQIKSLQYSKRKNRTTIDLYLPSAWSTFSDTMLWPTASVRLVFSTAARSEREKIRGIERFHNGFGCAEVDSYTETSHQGFPDGYVENGPLASRLIDQECRFANGMDCDGKIGDSTAQAFRSPTRHSQARN